MKLSQVLLRKRKMIHKPESFVRNWQWNNAWYLGQERPVENLGLKEALLERNIPVYTADEIISPIMPEREIDVVIPPPIQLTAPEKDETHPLWQDEPAYSYSNRSWQPRDQELTFALAVTNSMCVGELPERLEAARRAVTVTRAQQERLEALVWSCFIGDATQKKLPRNFKVPFIGWHPVESRMRPRNQYDWKAFSWGWHAPREYGIPHHRKLGNLSRGLFKEAIKNCGLSWENGQSIAGSKHRQFIYRPDGKLVRMYLEIPFMITSPTPLEPYQAGDQIEASPVPDVSPLDPVAGMFQTNIYERTNNHPVTSTSHTHPHITTVMDHYTNNIAPKFVTDKQTAKALLAAFTAAVGQARLVYGESVSGDLAQPITINSISTNGAQFVMSTFQLNSLDLGSSRANLFWHLPEPLQFFESCGYEEGVPQLTGLNMETYAYLQAFLTQGLAAGQQQKQQQGGGGGGQRQQHASKH